MRLTILGITMVAAAALACDGGRAEGQDRAGTDPDNAARAADVPSPRSTPASSAVPASRGGRDRIGDRAPAWDGLEWLGGRGPSLAELRGRVVLIRFWTETCPFCARSAPAFRELHEDYRERGLVVLGFHHPKPRGTERSVTDVRDTVRRFGWTFPVALDRDWSVLDAFWLSGPERRRATSVSFLLDRQGVIRFVHPGPELHPGGPPGHARCRADYRDLRRAVEALLDEGGALASRAARSSRKLADCHVEVVSTECRGPGGGPPCDTSRRRESNPPAPPRIQRDQITPSMVERIRQYPAGNCEISFPESFTFAEDGTLRRILIGCMSGITISLEYIGACDAQSTK